MTLQHYHRCSGMLHGGRPSWCCQELCSFERMLASFKVTAWLWKGLSRHSSRGSSSMVMECVTGHGPNRELHRYCSLNMTGVCARKKRQQELYVSVKFSLLNWLLQAECCSVLIK
jgi:hypothetical protein